MTNKDYLSDTILNYYANSIDSDELKSEHDLTNEQIEKIAIAEKDYFDLPCDEEGATQAQEEALNEYIENVIDSL